MRELFLELKNPIILQWRHCSILLRIETIQKGFSGVNNEFLNTSFLAYCLNEVHDVLPFVKIVHTQSTFHRHRNIDILNHRLAYPSHKIRIEHKLGSKTAINSFLRRTSTIEINLVVAPALHYFGSLTYFLRILTTDLTNNWMLIFSKV